MAERAKLSDEDAARVEGAKALFEDEATKVEAGRYAAKVIKFASGARKTSAPLGKLTKEQGAAVRANLGIADPAPAPAAEPEAETPVETPTGPDAE